MRVDPDLDLTYFKILNIGSSPTAREMLVDESNSLLYMIFGYEHTVPTTTKTVNLWGVAQINSAVGETVWA